MAIPTYVLARPPAGMDTHSLPVERVNQAILFSQLHTAELIEPGGTLIDVALVPELSSGDWRVRWTYGTIGSLPAGVREIFPDIDRITSAHMHPMTQARVIFDRASGRLAVTVEVPDPTLVVPQNSPGSATVLAQGETFVVDASLPDGQYLATLSGADLLIGAEVIATLPSDEAAQIQAYTFGIDSPAVRIFSFQGRVLIDVGLGDPVPVPALPPLPEPEPEPLPPTGPWAVTMPAAEAADPAPAGPRLISSPMIDERQ